MHFDLAHAAVAAILILLTLLVLRKSGLTKSKSEGGGAWSWVTFIAVFLVMFVLNVVWPYG